MSLSAIDHLRRLIVGAYGSTPVNIRVESDGSIVIAGFTDLTNGVAVVEQGQFDYETVAASQTDQVLGNTGGVGDFLHRLIIVPATTGAGNVSIKDGSGGAISVFVSGTLADLRPIPLEFNIESTDGAWKVTTGANVSVIGIGRFTA